MRKSGHFWTLLTKMPDKNAVKKYVQYVLPYI
jgi:hypothetical protein